MLKQGSTFSRLLLSLNLLRRALFFSELKISEPSLISAEKSHRLSPIGVVENKKEFEIFQAKDLLREIEVKQTKLVEAACEESFLVSGFCLPCNTQSDFLVDMQWGGRRNLGSWLPN